MLKKKKLYIFQNKRNKIFNKRYITIIKNLFKLFLKKNLNYLLIKQINLLLFLQQINNKFIFILFLIIKLFLINIINLKKKIYSILDRTVKKNIIHKNKNLRKKLTLNKIYSKIKY